MAKLDDTPVTETSAQATASSSKTHKKRKRDQTQSSSTPTTAGAIEAVPKDIDKRDRESWKRKKEKAKAHRNKKRRAERAIEHVAQPSSASAVGSAAHMTIEPIFTTSTGNIVHTQNAGNIFSEYLHAFNQDPTTFNAEYDFTLIPPADLAERKWKRDPKNPNQPPPGATYSCTITMPPGVVLRSATSVPPGLRSKMLAKQNAMGMMVKALVDAGEVSQNLEPKPTGSAVKTKVAKAKDIKDMKWFDKQGQLDTPVLSPDESIPGTTLTNRWIAFKEGMRDQLPPRPIDKDGRKGFVDATTVTSPDFWQYCPPFSPGVSVYPTLITLDIPDQQAECRTICLITTLPIPEIQESLVIDISVNKEAGREPIKAAAHMIARPSISKLDNEQLQLALGFTRRTIREHMRHTYDAELSKCPWLVLPMQTGYHAEVHDKVKRKHIDWDQVRTATTNQPIPFDIDKLSTLTKSAQSEIMYTVNSDFAQRDRIVKVRIELKPSSPHPKHPERTIASHAVRGGIEGPQPQLQYPNQPVFECTIANPGRHGGFPVELADPGGESSFVIPELGVQTGMSASVYRTTSILPTLFPRLDNILIARQMSEKLFNSTIKTPLALQALSAPMSVDSPLLSYERLEILGDTLLKLMATVDLYIRPRVANYDETKVQQQRHMVLSNRTLQTGATAAGVNSYIRHVKQKTKDWKPMGWTRSGTPVKEAQSHSLGAKVVSDVAEALIAASYLSQDRHIDSAISTATTLGVSLKALTCWSDAVTFAARQPVTSTDAGLGSLLGLYSQSVCGYKFRDSNRATCVLSRSKTREQTAEATKFGLLGDSLMEYFIIEELWDQYPEAGPQEITVMKHSRMNAPALSAMCALSPIFAQLQDIPRVSEPAYKKYRNAVTATKKQADKDILEAASSAQNGTESAEEEVGKEWWADMSQQNLVGDVAECVLGAVFEDACYDIEAPRKIYREHFAPFLGRYCLGPHRHSQHPKSQVDQFLMGKLGCREYQYRKDGAIKGSQEVGASVVVHGEVVAVGSAPWNELAIRRACVKVLAHVKIDPEPIVRLCDCRTKTPKEA